MESSVIGRLPPRRLSVGGSNNATTSVAMRKLSEPMHRCTVTNQNVSGIMRPARYSSNNLAVMADDDGEEVEKMSDQEYYTRNTASGNNHPSGGLRRSVSTQALSRLDGSADNGKTMKRCTSMLNLDEEGVRNVDWKSSIEIYVFTKTKT